jgi:hypothetical protein
MLFRQTVLEAIARGEVTLAFRRWKKAPPINGATQRTAIGVLALKRTDVIQESDISERDAKRAGAASRQELLASLRGEGTLLRIELQLIGEDPRIALRAKRLDSQEEVAAIRDKLARLDQRAERPWTSEVLALIAEHPGMLAALIAKRVGMERMQFKRRVRALKELGLTVSLEVGYRLSERGEDFVRTLRSLT